MNANNNHEAAKRWRGQAAQRRAEGVGQLRDAAAEKAGLDAAAVREANKARLAAMLAESEAEQPGVIARRNAWAKVNHDAIIRGE